MSQDISDTQSENDSAYTNLKNLRIQNRNGLIISYLNINSIRNKIESLRLLISDNVDILIVAETKIDRTFPSSQFYINGFKEPFRFDRDKNGGGLLIYVREGVPAKLKTDFKLPSNIECGIIEINLNKKKWLLLGIYRPPSQQEEYFFNEIGKALDNYSTTNENFIIVGDFNTEENGQNIRNFLDAHELNNLVKSPTCHKSDSSTCCSEAALYIKTIGRCDVCLSSSLSICGQHQFNSMHQAVYWAVRGGNETEARLFCHGARDLL